MPVTDILVPVTPLKVKSGGKLQITASLVGAPEKGEKAMFTFSPSDLKGGILDAKGMFLAPILEVEDVAVINVTWAGQSRNFTKPVNITVEETPLMTIEPGHNLVVLAGGEMQFTAKYGLPISPSWEIVDLTRSKGTIDRNTGRYKAPSIIDRTIGRIKIRVIDQNRNNHSTTVEVVLLPIELEVKLPARINAGQSTIRLDIMSKNDSNGIENFSCKFDGPAIGSLTEDGNYTPPKVLSAPTRVKIKISSKLDPALSRTIEFEVGLQLCPNCNTHEINTSGTCPMCGPVVASTVKKVLCPICKKEWDGQKCCHCNYPYRKKSII